MKGKWLVLSGGLLVLPLTAKADLNPIVLSCHARQADHADDRVKATDKIVIDARGKRIELISSVFGDGWTFANRGYNKELDWFDEITIRQFKDGAILAGGVRAKAIFGFNYNPSNGQVVYTFTNYGTPGFIIFDCAPP
ncbi:MAG: hypothetical protein EKK29_17205 [Hyphomicrobiales bacterium]|nr:MAG: hypothetical protein EKK29_17205 [Hyphomicrobiales bacterium]